MRPLDRIALAEGDKTGEAKATTAGNLPARLVIHTVGPVWRGGREGEPAELAACHRNSLVLASELGCRTVAFPAISTGAFGYPPERAAVALDATAQALAELDGTDLVAFVLFEPYVYHCFSEALDAIRAI